MINDSDLRVNVNKLYAKDNLFTLISIFSPSGARVDFCQGDKPFVSDGRTYTNQKFQFTKQKAARGEVPTASLVISNIGRELVREVEALGGGRGLVLRASMVRASEPDVHIDSVDLELRSLNINMLTVTFDLVVQNNFEKPAVRWRFDKKRYPGIFL